MYRVFLRCVGLLLLSAVPLVAQSTSAVPPKKPAGPAVRGHGGKVAARKPSAVAESAPPPPAPIVPLTPENMPAQPPRVSYRNGQLQIDSQNSTLADILNMVRTQTGAQIDPPPNGSERVAAHLSGTPREVLSALLDGSNVGYIILGSPGNENDVQKVMLTTLRSMPASSPSPPRMANNAPPQPEPEEEEAPPPQPFVPPPQPGQPMPGQTVIGPNGQPVTAQPGQSNAYAGGEQPRFGLPGQPPQQMAPQPGQPGQSQVKTPQQLLQELQQLRNRINVDPNKSLNDQQQ